MPIDFSKKIVFIHIPRTGGSSIEALLDLDGPQCFRSPTPLPHLVPASKTPQHFTWRELQPYLSPDLLSTAFKFAFVRNPWDRLVSEFHWRRSWCFRPPDKGADFFYRPHHLETLDAFVTLLELPLEERLDAKRGFDGHLEPQRSFIVDEAGRKALDWVARYEEFPDEVRRLAQRLNLGAVRIPHLGRSRISREYRRAYSHFSRSVVERFYADDIREFGYEF